MNEAGRPAWAKHSLLLRLDDVAQVGEVTPQWAFEGATGAGVRVAIIDSGIDADHPMLDDCVDRDGGIEFWVDDEGVVQARQGPHGDAYGHGTACAGIVHALAPAASITSVRVLGPNLTGKAAAFHAGLLWAVEQGFDVVNLSLGTTRSEWALPFHEVCDRAYFGGTFIVTAANNISRTSYPSLFASVASVACNTATDPLRFHVNPEPPTEFLARGIDVVVPWADGGTIVTTGNSFAAPHITALSALIASKHPSLRPFQLKSVLWATAANSREAAPVDIAGRRSTIAPPGARSTTLASLRAMDPARSAAPSGDRTDGSDHVQRPTDVRRRRNWTAEPTPEVRAGIRVGERVGRWRWGSIRLGHRAADDRTVRLVGLGELDTDDGVEHVRSGQSEIASWGSSTLVASEVFDQPPMLVIDAPLFTGDRLDVTGRADAATAVVAGVAELHRRGIVHGDLGRHWITRQADGTVAVRGAGVVALLPPPPADVGRLSPALLAHLAPEQLGGEPADAAGDVFAAALLWAQIVSGSSPFDDPAKLGAFLRYRLTARPTPTATLLGISDAVGAVLDAALSSAPSTRPADATVLLALLTSAQGDGGVPPVRSGAGGVASSP
jgi:hypothetical protein